jgi:hypothetical protein
MSPMKEQALFPVPRGYFLVIAFIACCSCIFVGFEFITIARVVRVNHQLNQIGKIVFFGYRYGCVVIVVLCHHLSWASLSPF